jgi:uncharacterized protein YqjF (DUF2071 family)
MLEESSSVGVDDRGPFVGEQSWIDLLFAHWPVSPRAMRGLVPEDLELDLWNGEAWIGVVPFSLRGLRPRHLPGIPGATDFLELNVRTYVRAGGLPGVFFFSLDASSSLAVLGARTLLGLPYRRAEMECRREADGWVRYRSERIGEPAVFEARYRGIDVASAARPGSLDEFLVERYRLFMARDGVVSRLEIDHPPWQLRRAQAEITANTVTQIAGVVLPLQPPLLHFVDRQDVRTGAPQRVT